MIDGSYIAMDDLLNHENSAIVDYIHSRPRTAFSFSSALKLALLHLFLQTSSLLLFPPHSRQPSPRRALIESVTSSSLLALASRRVRLSLDATAPRRLHTGLTSSTSSNSTFSHSPQHVQHRRESPLSDSPRRDRAMRLGSIRKCLALTRIVDVIFVLVHSEDDAFPSLICGDEDFGT